MPVTAQEYIPSCVDVAIMRHTTVAAYPLALIQICDTYRPRLGHAATRRTDLGSIGLVNFRITATARNRLVPEHLSESKPSCIGNRLSQSSLGQVGCPNISNGNMAKLVCQSRRCLVKKITPLIRNFGVDLPHLPSLSSPLRLPKLRLRLLEASLSGYYLAGGQSGEIVQTQVNPHRPLRPHDILRRNFDHDIEVPPAPSIAGEPAAVFDLRGLGQFPREPNCVIDTCEPKPLTRCLYFSSLNRNPTQRPVAAVTKVRPASLLTRSGVLETDGVNGAGMEPQQLTATDDKQGEVKSAWPFLVPFQGVMLSIIAVIPNCIHLARHAVQRLGVFIFNPVSVCQDYCFGHSEFYSVLVAGGSCHTPRNPPPRILSSLKPIINNNLVARNARFPRYGVNQCA